MGDRGALALNVQLAPLSLTETAEAGQELPFSLGSSTGAEESEAGEEEDSYPRAWVLGGLGCFEEEVGEDRSSLIEAVLGDAGEEGRAGAAEGEGQVKPAKKTPILGGWREGALGGCEGVSRGRMAPL